MRIYIHLTLIAALFGTILLSGCSKPGDSTASTDNAALISSGKTAVASAGCIKCHGIEGQGGGRAPDLSHVGADSQHTAQWLADYVKDPKSKDANSRMPAFGGRVSDKDLQSIGAYLASLK